MTIAIVNINIDNAKLGPDKNILPSLPGNIVLLDTDTESAVFRIEGFRSLGLIDTGNLTGVTDFEIHVSNLSDGTFAPLDITAFVAGVLTAHSTTFIAGWRFAKIVLGGDLSVAGNIPICLA